MKIDYIQGLLTALEEADTETRIKVASALRMLEDKRTTIGLIKALDDACEGVRYEAIRALSTVADPSSFNVLVFRLRDEDWIIRRWAAFGLRARKRQL